MALIKSISGIRGTIGGYPGESLTTPDVVKYTAGFGSWIKSHDGRKVVVGRDARLSGPLISNLVCSTLQSLGLDVVDVGLSTTPTVELAITEEKAGGGIVITASHNPIEWNALKLLNEQGEIISAGDGEKVLKLADKKHDFADTLGIGSLTRKDHYIDYHIDKVLGLDLVKSDKIKDSKFKIVVDSVNSTGGIAVPKLLSSLGVSTIHTINCEPTGKFNHNPEPLPENLTEICTFLKDNDYDLGVVVDPDVDRLALICENGEPFGEEYTLVAVADYVLSHTKGNTVSNLSSTKALKDVTLSHGGKYFPSAVGEVNVVKKMKEMKGIIGGEGNGGIIYPDLHYGRDALVGVALFLSLLAEKGTKVSELKAEYPNYFISKKKIEIKGPVDLMAILNNIASNYNDNQINREDGIRLDFDNSWVHLRKSNTEPIIRVIAESDSMNKAESLADEFMEKLDSLAKATV